MRQIGNAGEDLAQSPIKIGGSFFQFRNLFAQLLALRHGRTRVLPALFEFRDLL